MKIFFLSFLICLGFAAQCAEIKFLDNPVWTSVLEQAKKENKMIFLDAYATWCAPCKQMDEETYQNDAVANYYNTNFINVRYDMEKGEGPMLADRYYVASYPNLVFISPTGVMLHKAVGFIAANDFLAVGQSAVNPETQYYAIKKKALQLDDATFLQFAKQATALQDDDFGLISRDFLAAKADILGNEALVDLMMNYIYALPQEKDLAYFSANKPKILKDSRYSEDDFQERLVSLAVQFALSEDVQVTEELDFEAMKKVLEKYVPNQAFFVFNYFKTQYYLENKETAQALVAFDEILNHPSKVAYPQIANAMINIGSILFEEDKLESYLAKFEAIKVPANETDYAYLKNFVKAIVYLKTKQTDKFRVIANTILADTVTPEEVKKDLKLALQNMAAN